MSILSVTFHTTEKALEDWNNFTERDLPIIINSFSEVKQYILSEIESDMVQEGKNTNLLLIFANDLLRKYFVDNELTHLSEMIIKRFGEEVMVFRTYLNPLKLRF